MNQPLAVLSGPDACTKSTVVAVRFFELEGPANAIGTIQ